jgi:hypothetical protein
VTGDLREMDHDDHESTLRLLADLRSLIREERLSVEQRLLAIDHALGLAIGGPPEQARDFVRDVTLGRLEP